MIDLYAHYRAGHLARAGGVLDQPCVYLRGMQHIDAEVRSQSAQKRR